MFRSRAKSSTVSYGTVARYRHCPCTTKWGDRIKQVTTFKRDITAFSGLGDDMLDFIQAGPKLRKWYGETDMMLLPKDGGGGNDEDEEDDDSGPREAVVVVGADSELGQLVVMQLVLARAQVRVLVKNSVKTKQEFGPYVTVVQGDVNNSESLKKVLKNARSVIITGSLGKSARAAGALGLEHIVLPSLVDETGFSLSSVFGSPESSMRDPKREAEVEALPVPYTIVRFNKLEDRIGGNSKIDFYQAESNTDSRGLMSRDDLAAVLATAVQYPPSDGKGVVFSVGSSGSGDLPDDSEWMEMFSKLQCTSNSQKAAA